MSPSDRPAADDGTDSQRHKACNKCRLRKVRCDGARPFCKQCARGRAAWECFYPASARRGRPRRPPPPTPAIPTPPLALEGSALSVDTATDLSLSALDRQAEIFKPLLPDESSIDSFFDSIDYDLSVFRDSDLGSRDCFTVETTPEDAQIRHGRRTPPLQLPTKVSQPSVVPESAAPDRSNDLPSVFEILLFKTYFNTRQTTIRLFDNLYDFLQLADQRSSEAMALRYAIVAHAVPACPQFLAWATINLDVAPGDDFAAHFYRLACEALGECSFKHELHRPSLRALQATVLIGLYELHRAHFGRAWLTVSRADWLTQTMQLRTLDSDEAPFLDSPELLDEARRAQWATSSLACMLMMGERMGDSIEEATTWLPGPPASEKSQASGISVGDIFRNAAPRPLSVEEALLAAHMLTRRVVVHVRETRVRSCWPDRQPYSFWTNQHRLEQTLQYIRNFLKTDPKPEPRLETMLDLYVRAWSIVLYEAKLRRTDASSWNAGDAGRQGAGGDALLQQTLELAQALQTRVLPVDAASLITVSWVVYVALQSLLRGKRRLSNLLHTGPIAVTCALVMDSFDALQSMLAKLGVDSPIANFFLSQVETEKSCSDAALGKCLVGLADFNVG